LSISSIDRRATSTPITTPWSITGAAMKEFGAPSAGR
jgi:hypothetical protein